MGKSKHNRRELTPAEEIEEILRTVQTDGIDALSGNIDELADIRKRLNPLGHVLSPVDNKQEFYAYSFINLKEEYIKKFIMTSLIGFLFRRADEFGVSVGDHPDCTEDLDKDKILKDFIEENLINGKVVLKEEKSKDDGYGGGDQDQAETNYNKLKRIMVNEFLRDTFIFNPDQHVRSAYLRNKHDPDRRKIKTKNGKVNNKKNKRGEKKTPYNKMTLEEKNMVEYGRMTGTIPPADVFHHFTRYMNQNYEACRKATEDLYADKPDLEVFLNIHGSFPTMEAYQEFIHEHEGEIQLSIHCAQRGKYVIQTAFKENRERLQYYNKNTRVMEELVEQAQAGEKLGKDLMQKRIRTAKEKNEAENGPDEASFIEYKKSKRKQYNKAGLKELSEKERKQADLEKRMMSKADYPEEEVDDYNAVQLGIHITDGKHMKTSQLFIESEAPKEGEGVIAGGGIR